MDDFNWVFNNDEIETPFVIDNQVASVTTRHNVHKDFASSKAADVLKQLPKPDESLHIISNGSFDYFDFVTLIASMLDAPVSLFASTWTMNNKNVDRLFELFDEGAINDISILTGLYFKRRNTEVYAKLLDGIRSRNQKIRCLKNHAKIMGFFDGTSYIVAQGSANFTANPRIEQHIITNSEVVWRFHKNWIDEVLNA